MRRGEADQACQEHIGRLGKASSIPKREAPVPDRKRGLNRVWGDASSAVGACERPCTRRVWVAARASDPFQGGGRSKGGSYPRFAFGIVVFLFSVGTPYLPFVRFPFCPSFPPGFSVSSFQSCPQPTSPHPSLLVETTALRTPGARSPRPFTPVAQDARKP